MHIDDVGLGRALKNLDGLQLDHLDLREALGHVTSAMPDLFGVDGAGLLLIDDLRVLRSIAATDATAGLLEKVQEETATGPCVDTLVEDVPITCADLTTDDRWPLLSPGVTAAGVRAVLGVPVHLGGGPVGSLNVFRAVVHHWDDSDVAAITAFAHVVDHVLTLAVIGRNQDTLVKQLQEALVSRVKVERAVGVLMAVRDVDAPAAFELIRGAARSSRRRVQEVADDIITRRGLPDGS